MSNKDIYRQQCLARRKAMSADQRQQAGDKIVHQLNTYLLHMPDIQQASRLIYRSLENEVDTASLFTQALASNHLKIYAPATRAAHHMQWHQINSDTKWRSGAFGVSEPENGAVWSAQDGSAVLVCPLVGFDRNGNRLGFGKGCFDRWLADNKGHILLKIGLAFSCQECPPIPAEAHDIALDVIFTENEVITCRNN